MVFTLQYGYRYDGRLASESWCFRQGEMHVIGLKSREQEQTQIEGWLGNVSTKEVVKLGERSNVGLLRYLLISGQEGLSILC